MKKTVSIALIIGLVALIFCFAACGNNNVQDNVTSMENGMTSILDDATTLMEELSTGLDDMLGVDETTDEMTTDETTTAIGGETTSAKTTAP